MTQRWWGILGLLILVPAMLLSGCTAGEAYRGAASPEAHTPYTSPALSDTDPALRQWYTAPYFDPYEMP
jgi:hypothetical protein